MEKSLEMSLLSVLITSTTKSLVKEHLVMKNHFCKITLGEDIFEKPLSEKSLLEKSNFSKIHLQKTFRDKKPTKMFGKKSTDNIIARLDARRSQHEGYPLQSTWQPPAKCILYFLMKVCHGDIWSWEITHHPKRKCAKCLFHTFE